MESRTRRAAALFVAMAMIGALVSGCGSTSPVSSWTDFDSNRETAIVLLGTKFSQRDGTPRERTSWKAVGFNTYWQAYDPQTLRLVPSDSLVFSFRTDTIIGDEELHKWEVEAVEIPPGSYALTVVLVDRTMTAFVRGTSGQPLYTQSLSGLSINIDGPVDPKRNYLFEVGPGQVAYLGHFQFFGAAFKSDLVAKVDYFHDEAAARAVLKEYPGITGEMVTLDLVLPTEQAAR